MNKESIAVRIVTRRRIHPQTGCWEWKGSLTHDGYAQILVGDKRLYVHRLSAWLWLDFDLTSRLLVCHHCDNPRCFRPDHLFVGTDADNMLDMARKGRANNGQSKNGYRGPKGSMMHNAKLNEHSVGTILDRLASGETQTALASEYHISQNIIGRIARGISWKHVHRPASR